MSLDLTKHNVGSTDRVIRGVIGLLLVIAAFRGGSLFVGGIGAALMLTAYLAYCPTYSLFKIHTTKEPTPAAK